MRCRTFLFVLPIALLASCSDSKDTAANGEALDPASEQALNEELMTDPDLAGSSEANAAVSGTGDHTVPKINTSPQAIEAARARAAELVGGANALKSPPKAKRIGEGDTEPSALAAAARAAVSPGGANCAEKVDYTTAWAARLPGAFPVYPRANTVEAAGTDAGNCALRIVTFRTPVPLGDVMAFYNTRALANGYGVEHTLSDGDDILSGMKGNSAFVVYGRTLPSKVTEIDLVTSTR